GASNRAADASKATRGPLAPPKWCCPARGRRERRSSGSPEWRGHAAGAELEMMMSAFQIARLRAFVAPAAVAVLLVACAAPAASPSLANPPSASGSTASALPSAPTNGVTPAPTATPQPTLGFTFGTVGAPRVVEITTDDLLNFSPGVVQAAMGETVMFRIHNTGKATHEFMVGPLAAAFADKEGTPEVADIEAG